jgi:hypothetical protein
MKSSNGFVLVAALIVVVHPACSSHTSLGPDAGPPPPDGGGGQAPDSSTVDTGGGDVACPGTTGAAGQGETPTEHRAVAAACTPSTRTPPPPDGGLTTCTSNADCMADGGTPFTAPFTTCLHGVCSFDQCLTDADCPNGGVCGCASDYYGGNAAYHPNVCVPANCHTDADCGAGGFCSPSRTYCGSYTGFYCHGPQDTCVNPTVDCAGCPGTTGNACVYAPTVGAFVCGQNICGG